MAVYCTVHVRFFIGMLCMFFWFFCRWLVGRAAEIPTWQVWKEGSFDDMVVWFGGLEVCFYLFN